MITLVKLPVPVPSVVLVERFTVGLLDVLQTMPRLVIGAPPSELIDPPPVPVVVPVALAAEVLTDGNAMGSSLEHPLMIRKEHRISILIRED